MSGNNFGGYRPALISLLQIVRYNSVPDTRKIKICATPHEVKINRDWYKNELRSIFQKCKNKELDPIIGEIIPFDQVAKAHRLIESSSIAGKVVLKIAG
jgi:NADPH:quinone reductase-like Zn-dependent oxidoreductase